MTRWFGRFAIGFAGLAFMIAAANARITHIEITKSEPAFGGQSFGDTGVYERLTGRVTGELDPADPANSGIQDINLAPRNERGMVEYVTNIELLKPADMARGNRVLFFEVNNRGNKLAPGSFNAGVAGGVAERNALSSPGDGWLMRAGYTMVWFGWEMDVRPGMSRVGMPPIVAHNHDGSAITGIVRSEIITPRSGDQRADHSQPADPELSDRQLRQLSDGGPRQYRTVRGRVSPNAHRAGARAGSAGANSELGLELWNVRAGRCFDAGREACLLSRRLQTGTSLRTDLPRQGSDRGRPRICRGSRPWRLLAQFRER